MKTVKISKSESVLLTIVTLCAMYFLGHVLVGFFQSFVLPYVSAVWQDENSGFLATIAPIAAGVKLKDVKEIKPLPFTVETKQTSTGKDAYSILFKDNQERNVFLGLCKIANLLTFNYGYDKESKIGKIGMLVSSQSEKFVKDYNSMTFGKAQKLGAESLEERAKQKEIKKAEKAANKGTAKVGNNAVSAKIQALKDLYSEGLITAEVLADKIANIK